MLAIPLLPEHAEPDRAPLRPGTTSSLKGNPMTRDPVSGREIVRGGHVLLPRCRPGEQIMHSGSMEVSVAKPGRSHGLHLPTGEPQSLSVLFGATARRGAEHER